MSRVTNFNAGPAAIPLPVLETAQRELLEFDGTGMSIMEHSHRGKAYEGVHHDAIARLKKLLGAGDDHEVLLIQGGANQQFAQIPMNLLPAGASADYILTGQWGDKAFAEAQLASPGAKIRAAYKAPKGPVTKLPAQGELDLDAKATYVHLTSNETIDGNQWQTFPDVGAVPLVADMSSDFLSRRIDTKRYGIIYAGAQKNLGPSGVTCVVITKELVERGRKDIPAIFRYQSHAAAQSLYNTPPTFAIYLVRGVLQWIEAQGGLAGIEAINEKKAQTLYGAIDADPEYWKAPVDKAVRSRMNVVFRLPTEDAEERFVKEATKAGMIGLKGHRSVGGIRASIYNAVSQADVDTLVSFMKSFKR